MNPDRRAEIRPQIKPVIADHQDGDGVRHIGRPPTRLLATRLLLATVMPLGAVTALEIAQRFSAQTPVVRAAEQCTGSINIIAFRYFDRYPVDKTGSEGMIDGTDFVLEPLPKQTVYLYQKDKKPFNPPKSAVLEPGPDYSYVKFEIKDEDKVECDFKDRAGRDVASVYYEFGTNRGELYRFNTPNKGDTWWYGGVKEDNVVRLEEYLITGNNVLQVGNKTQQAFQSLTGGKHSLFATDQEIRDDRSDGNKEIIRKYINQSKEVKIDWLGLTGRVLVFLIFVSVVGGIIDAINEKRSKRSNKTTPQKPDPNVNGNKEDLQSQLEELQSQLKNTTQDNITLRTRAQELEHQVEDLQDLRETAEGLTVKVDGLTQENVTLKSSNNALVEHSRRLHDEVDKLNAVSFKVHEDNRLLSAQLEELRLKFNELRLQLTGVIQENVTLRSDRGTLESQARKLQDAVDKLNKELERIKTEAKNKQGNPKNPEWVTGQQEFEKRWQAAKSKLSTIRPGDTGNEPEYILDRFKAATGIIQEVSLGSAIGISTLAMRVRAGLEYLIPQIWPDNRVLKRFFDPNFNAGYLLYAESLARIVYLPENYRNLSSFTPDQKRDIRRIRRILIYALHPDTAKVDADKNLQESVDDLLKRFNPAWSYIENLIK